MVALLLLSLDLDESRKFLRCLYFVAIGETSRERERERDDACGLFCRIIITVYIVE